MSTTPPPIKDAKDVFVHHGKEPLLNAPVENWQPPPQDMPPPSKASHQDHSTAKQKLTLRSVLELLGMTFPEADLVWKSGYLAKGERAAWCGMGGLGKSRLVTQMAVCTRLGQPFLGWPTNGVGLRWLFLQTENGNRRLQADLAAMMQPLTEEELKTVSDGVSFHSLESDTDGMVWLDKPHSYQAVEDAILESKADIVVFDPLRDFTTGNLNDDGDMTEVLALLNQVVKKGNPQRIPLIIHHAGTGKGGIAKATGYDRSSFGRNSKVLFGWTRSQINLAPAYPDSNDVLIVASGKNNNSPEFSAFAIRLDPLAMMYDRDDSFDVSKWEGRVSGDASTKPDVEALVNLVREAGGRLDKQGAIEKLRNAGATKREAEEVVKTSLQTQLKEEKEKRSGRRDAVLLALR
jgi:hypothetical protein